MARITKCRAKTLMKGIIRASLSAAEFPSESVYDEIDAQLKVGQEQAEAQAEGREGE